MEDVQFFFSEGHKAASWRIYSPRTPLFVGLFNSSYGVSWSACDWSVPDIKSECHPGGGGACGMRAG